MGRAGGYIRAGSRAECLLFHFPSEEMETFHLGETGAVNL